MIYFILKGKPVDFGIPESSLMHAVYLAIPQAENERRSLNTKNEIRRTKQMGRYPGKAPIGYTNQCAADGKKYIAPHWPDANIIKWSFQQLAKNAYRIEDVRRMANTKGLQCSRSNFWKLLHNPVYCGFVPCALSEFEERQLVEGVHEPIITPTLYDEVQNIINTKRRAAGKTHKANDMFVLNKYLICPVCNRKLCGSFSKGRSKRYPYYHCKASSKIRFKVSEQIKEQELFIARVRKLFVSGKIEFDDFFKLKKEYLNISSNLNDELNKVTIKLSCVDKQLNSVYSFDKILSRFKDLNISDKMHLISFISPGFVDISGDFSLHLNHALYKILSLKKYHIKPIQNVPLVENDRRALNVFYGMRRAKKEGRWMGTAPVGYINKVYENGRKYIAPKDKDADIMRWVFKNIAEEIFNTEQIWKLAKQKGLKCSKNNFWVAIRNPIYCGKIFIPKYKDEESRFVIGQHEPLITEALFLQAQDVLNGRGRKILSKPKIVSEDLLPLRGFVNCPKCTRALTGSASKGRTQYYYYYHCLPSCGFRQKAEVMNAAFLLELKKYVPHVGIAELFKSIIQDVNKNQAQNSTNERRHVLNQIEEQNARITKSRNLLLADSIVPEDYKLIKAEAEEKINSLEARIAAYNVAIRNIDNILNAAASAISSLDLLYETGNTKQKREIIGSIFSDKLVFENGAYRTTKVNEAAGLIYFINNDLQGKKNGTNQVLSDLSHWVNPQGLEPWTR